MNFKKINSELFYCYNYFIRKPKYNKQIKYKVNSNFNYDDFISGFDIPKNSQIFIHAGLKLINLITNDKYDVIIRKLINSIQKNYEPKAIITPAFTPSFRKTGVYSKNYSKGEYGVFSELPRHQASFRTNDAIHGVAIFTNHKDEFDKYNYSDTFAKNGFYASLIEDTYILNITTNYFVSTYMHFIEDDLEVPYKKAGGLSSSGILYDEEDKPFKIMQNNHHYIGRGEINREKVRKILEKTGVLCWKEYLGLKNSCISVKNLDEILRKKILDDPYYLVTF